MEKKISERIIQFAKSHSKFQIKDLKSAFNEEYSRQYLSKSTQNLVRKQELIKSGVGVNTFYAYKDKVNVFVKRFERRFKNQNVSEEKILEQIRQESFFKNGLSENIQSILEYALSEMINNAIEHSKSKNIHVIVEKGDKKVIFYVIDYGVGVFRNVMKKFNLNTEYDAINELLKGKVTTQPRAHSGEGIFFTSKISDRFWINSKGYKLVVDNEIEDVFVENPKEKFKGSEIFFEININSNKHLSDIFYKYRSNPESYAFDKTRVTIKLYTFGTIYMSRSQARRVLSNLDKFEHIVLDFQGVPTIGQAFADEIFRIYKNKRPDVVIETVNTNKNIDFMIGRVG